MGRAAAAQLDQEPEAAAGTLFPRHHWRAQKEMPPDVQFVLNAWDTAVKEKEQIA